MFDRLARAVCRAECLPRKELYESWEVARRVRRHFRGGRVIELAAGHGLLSYAMLLLDDSSERALAIDRRKTESASRLAPVLEAEWPRLRGRVEYVEAAIDGALPIALGPGDLVVGAHACGALTDRVLELAIGARARVAVLPCCHDVLASDLGGIEGWVDGPLAVDLTRAQRLAGAGYRIRTARIPEAITEKNRLLLGEPSR